MTRKTLYTKIQDYVTQSTWLPKINNYTPHSTWSDTRVEAIDAKIHSAQQDKYDFTATTNQYCFSKQNNTGFYYLCDESYHAVARYYSLVPHAFGVLSMMVLDVVAIIYNTPRLFYNLLTGNPTSALANLQQICFRVINFLTKPFQWAGLMLSVVLGIFYPDNRDKTYVNIERDIYLGVFSFGPFIPLDTQEDGAKEPLLSELVHQAKEISLHSCFKQYQSYKSVDRGVLARISDSLYVNRAEPCEIENKATQNTLVDKACAMKEGETIEDLQLRVLNP